MSIRKAFMKLNQKGLSLPEILISLGVMGALGIGVSNLITESAKKKNELDHRMNRMTIEKRIENYFYSDDGCSSLKGKAIGDTVTLDPNKFPAKLGKTEMHGLRISGFVPTDEKGIHGIAKLSLTMKEKGIPKASSSHESGAGTGTGTGDNSPHSTPITNEKNFIREIPVPVNVKNVGTSQVIEDCRLNKTQSFADIVKRVCEGSFGSMTQGMSCADAIALVESKIIKEICTDIYGSKLAQFNTIHCNVNQIHANKSCSGQVALGFDTQGNILCKNVPVTGAASGTPGPGPGPVPSLCKTWSAWAPSADTLCNNIDVTQTRNCLDAGSTTSETQVVKGNQDCGGDCLLERPLAWEVQDTKKGVGTCVEEEAGAIKLTNWQSYKATARESCAEAGLSCTGTYVLQCQNGKIVPLSSGCAIGKNDWSRWNIYCFVAGTKVTLANGTQENIERVKLGDKVLTFDEATGQQVARPVKEVFHHEESYSILYTFRLIDGSTVTSNDEHLFFIPELINYQSADEIFWRWKRGEQIRLLTSKKEEVLIASIEQSYKKVKLYNIHVKGLYDKNQEEHQLNHNFFANGILVHNEKAMWDLEEVTKWPYTCCTDIEFKESYPRGIFCSGTKKEKEAFDACWNKL